MKRIAIISAAFPPDLDGIGDYSCALANALSADDRVRLPIEVVTSLGEARVGESFPTKNIRTSAIFDVTAQRSYEEIVGFVERKNPDWLVVQYNPFAFGSRGFCPGLISALRRVKRLSGGGVKLAVMFHEVATDDATASARVMWVWQIWLARQLAALADSIFVSCEAYASKLGKMHGRRATILPVGSNLPTSKLSVQSAKEALGWTGELVLGSFGTCHPSRKFEWIAAAVQGVQASGVAVKFIHVGPAPDGALFPAGITRLPGAIPPRRAADIIRAMDLFLSPFSDGISMRRGSAVAALQHAVPVVTTWGRNTDRQFSRHRSPVFLSSARSADQFVRDVLKLVESREIREHLGECGFDLYRNTLAWPMIAKKLLTHLL